VAADEDERDVVGVVATTVGATKKPLPDSTRRPSGPSVNTDTPDGSVAWAICRGEVGSVQAYSATLAASTRLVTEAHHDFTLR